MKLNKFNFTNEEIAEQRAIDSAARKREWADFTVALAGEVGKSRAEEIALALGEMYSLFGEDIVDWLASLYDKESGGFYYSESARDSEGYGPDVESTYQAVQYLYCLDMVADISERRDSGELYDILPKEYCDRMKYWIKSLQDKDNGYIYHPQWQRSEVDRLVARRGRDLAFGMTLLRRLAARPTYATPLGDEGDGILPSGERVTVKATARKAESAGREIAEHLIDLESFKKYLAALPIDTSPYSVGNLMESQIGQIVARDTELSAEGAGYSLCDTLKEFFDSHQNPVTGLWTHCDTVTHEGTNGLLKIGSTYDRMGKPIPNPIRALRSAKEGIALENPDTVCYVLNPWYAISIVSSNAMRFSGEEGEREAREFKEALVSEYPALVRETAKKMRLFKKVNGPFSFRQKATMALNQGIPAAIPGTNEGDTNATNCMRGCLDHVRNILHSVLGVKPPRVYGLSDYMHFINSIQK